MTITTFVHRLFLLTVLVVAPGERSLCAADPRDAVCEPGFRVDALPDNRLLDPALGAGALLAAASAWLVGRKAR